MLYLAEVHKSGFLNQKVILKLLALQDSEQWCPVSGEEVPVIAATQLNSIAGFGTLVLVDLSPNRQVESIQTATEPVMAMIQNAAQSQEIVRQPAAKIAEIDEWQQSTQLQQQALDQRVLELDACQQELDQREIQATTAEVYSPAESVGTPPGQLQQEQKQTEHFDQCLGNRDRLAQLQQSLQQALAALKHQQVEVERNWPPAQQQDMAQQQAVEQAQQLTSGWQAWHQTQYALEQDRAELKLQASTLSLGIEQAEFLRRQIQAQANLYEQISLLAEASGDDRVDSNSDQIAIAQMPDQTLSARIAQLQQDLEQMSGFVKDQEAELAMVEQTIQTLAAQPQLNSSALEELAFERQRYQLLNETLGGQRRSLRERAATLRHHQAMLQLRQGGSNPLLDLLQHLATQQQQQILARQTIINKIDQTRTEIEHRQAMLEQREQDQAAKRAQLDQREQNFDRQRSEGTILSGQVNTRQELQPLKTGLNELHQCLSAIAAQTNQIQQALAVLEPRPDPVEHPSEPSF